MDYDLDMPPYVADMAAWLDDGAVHPCNGEDTHRVFEIAMGICRSVVDGGQVALPLAGARDEIDDLRKAIPSHPVLVSCPGNAGEYSS
jgi:hypothetical protein